MFDRELMRQLATIPSEDRAGWIAERKKLEALAGEMTRLNVEEMIPKYGIARVLRVLAATIKKSPMEYDSDAVAMANWIPPIRAGRNAEEWFCSTMHRGVCAGNFFEVCKSQKVVMEVLLNAGYKLFGISERSVEQCSLCRLLLQSDAPGGRKPGHDQGCSPKARRVF